MSSTANPYGLQPVNYPTGIVTYNAIQNGIVYGYTSDIGLYSPVTLATAGVLNISGTNEDIFGSFAGCEYMPLTGSLEIKSKNWVSGTAYVTGTLTAYVYSDPKIQYKIQCNGSLAQTSIGDEADFSNPSTVNTAGFSQAAISSTLKGNGNTGQLRIVNLAPNVDNAWGDSYTDVFVQLARQQFQATKAAI